MTGNSNNTDPKDIYYFGYGPICNDLVRRRRGIETAKIQAAYLPDYRLTFAFGGNANIVSKVGYEVHGLLMKLKSHEDWEKLRDFEAGNTPTIRTVVPYHTSYCDNDSHNGDSHNADCDFAAKDTPPNAVQAFLIEMPNNVDDTLLEAPIERLPQERYLKLIAEGMRQYQVDEDYIIDQIETCPFIPKRNPADYFTFPVAKKVRKISLARYQKLCQRAKEVEGDLYFCLGRQVFRLGEHDPANPLATWFETHGHGKICCTYMVHLTVVDPEIPFLDDPTEVTPLHIAWAENHLVEVVEQYGLSANRVYELVDKEDCTDEEGDLDEDDVALRRPSLGRWIRRRMSRRKR